MFFTAFLNKFQYPGALRKFDARGMDTPRDVRGHVEPQLSSATRSWLTSVPIKVHPHFLAVAYPGVINQLAQCWSDPMLTDTIFECLLADQRAGVGVPVEVALELVRLHQWHESRLSGAGGACALSSSAWQLYLPQTSD